MSINFLKSTCQSQTNQYKFGLCDDPNKDKDPAYIDTVDCSKWIAIVENNQEIEVIFTAIDNCIEILRSDGKMDNRCDGMLTYNNNIIFVELKERKYTNSVWIDEGENQLRKIISVFINNHDLQIFKSKKAYIANSKKPQFQYSHKERMQKFRNDTGFTLIIQNTIKVS
ncbi:hypothetical protein [Dolichospermum circinale]|uniref:hypothetical protein n=1 Tax=Dolichospermum circinale TaxID=109265 RepID=UPI00232CFA45|nr:hypothetical protein [Dolichospermum circinale]MDB9454910.1 hypothetical protein [Dolichospermum circinale CS-541/06]MDB9464520.1 hypothetical protein [Dolichospermum circinale CS-541/04]MDB9547244.1 hypothetical protein [Dolichospermum circinale CS-1031]